MLLAALALAGCAMPGGVRFDEADAVLDFEKDGFRVTGGEAFRFDFDPTPATMEQHGVSPARWIGVNVTIENTGTRPRHLAGPEGDPLAIVDPFDVRVVDADGTWAKLFTGRRWQDGELVNGDVFAPGEKGTFSILFFDSQKLSNGPIALFIGKEGVQLEAVQETTWTFRM